MKRQWKRIVQEGDRQVSSKADQMKWGGGGGKEKKMCWLETPKTWESRETRSPELIISFFFLHWYAIQSPTEVGYKQLASFLMSISLVLSSSCIFLSRKISLHQKCIQWHFFKQFTICCRFITTVNSCKKIHALEGGGAC